MTSRNYPAVLVAAMLVLTAVASMPVAASSHESVEVETVGALDVTAENATLVGNLTELDNASSADVWFEYWEEGDPANTTNTTELTQTGVGEFEIDVEGLESDTTYVAVAHTEAGSASDEGTTVTFTTDAVESVSVATDDPTLVTDDSATLNGELTDLEGAERAEVWFEYWTAGDRANNSTTTAVDLTEPEGFSASVDGLANNTTYVYVAHAATENVSDEGEPVEFTTGDRFAPLGVETLPATDVTNTSATLNGELTGLSGETEAEVWFEYWPQGDAANATTVDNQTLTAPGSFSEAVSGLENDTTYVYVAHATANDTTVAGENVSFTTDDGVAEAPTWDGEGPFGRWLTSILKNLVPPDSDVPFGQIVSDIVTSNNPGNGQGPPDHAGPPWADDDRDDEGDEEDDRGPPDHAGPPWADDDRDEEDDGDVEFDVTVDGDIAAGEDVTVTVTHDGTGVENATVTLNGEVVGSTDADGQLVVTLPDDLDDEVEIEAETEAGEGEWEHEIEADDG